MDMGKRVNGLNKIIEKNKKICFYAFALLAAIALTYVTLSCVLKPADAKGVTAEVNDKNVNVLVLGTDRQAGLCDVMMLVSIDRDANVVTAVQIPRDTYAQYTNGSYKKLNGAYNSLGGARATADWLASAFDIRIDHYVCVGLDTVREIVDAMGGVDVDIPCDMVYSDAEQGLYIKLDAGIAHLDGEGAEQFLRFRYSYVGGDVARLDAHKIFLSALYKKAAQGITPAMLMRLCAAASDVETDMALPDMLELGLCVKDMDGNSIFLVTLPGREAIAKESGASYYVLFADGARRIMQGYFGGGDAFDANEYFLNKRYKSFEDIYFEECTPEIFSVSDILGQGINIELH